MPIKTTGERAKKHRASAWEKDSLGQLINKIGGRTLGTGGAAPNKGHEGRPPRGLRAERKQRRRLYSWEYVLPSSIYLIYALIIPLYYSQYTSLNILRYPNMSLVEKILSVTYFL